MPGLSVSTQLLWGRTGPAPTLTVTDDPGRWCAVELAAAPEDLGAPSTFGGGASWASWHDGMVPPGPITVPEDAWRALRSAQRLYYRAHSSASRTTWVAHRVTVPDGSLSTATSIRLCDVWTSGEEELVDAPVPQVLEALEEHPELPSIIAEATVAMLICLHRFSPKRPVDPSQLELVVLLAGASAGQTRILVQRLAYRSLSPISAHVEVVDGTLTLPHIDPGESPIVDLVGTEAVRWRREARGPFLVLRNNSPAPEEEGGTCIVVTDHGQCAYYAKTTWSGQSEVVVPGQLVNPGP